jgi:predicted amidohydrolase
MELRVAGAQIPVTRDVHANAELIRAAIAHAADEGANVLLTPEGSLSGYTHEFDAVEVQEALRRVVSLASQAGIALALGTCFVEPADGRCYNQVRFYDAAGRFLGFHSKTLTCGTLTDPPEGEINHFATVPLRTFELSGVRVGALICNDLWANPGCTPQPDSHLTQQLSRMGARVVFHAVNGGRDGSEWSALAWQYHEANLRMRARAAGVWIVTVDSSHPLDLPCSAPSGVIDPQGNWLARTPEQGVHHFVATLTLD